MNENYVTLGQVCDKGSSNIAQKDLAEREGQYPIYGAAGLIKNVDFAHQKQPYIAVVKDGAGIGRVMKLPAYSSVIGTMQYIFPKESVDIDYLFYALQHMNLGKYFSGSTIPHIYFRDYQKERLKLPVMEVQQRQADTLSRIDAISAYGQRQIALMDEIVKSRFVEMFGAIPESEFVTMESVCSLITDGTHQPPKFVDNGIPFLFVSNITTNELTYDADKFISSETYADLMKRTPVEIGDILLSTVGSYGHPAVVKSDRKFSFQRHIAFLKPRRDVINSIYLHGVILTSDIQRQIDARVKGIAQKTLNLSEVRTLRFPLPPMKEQNRFAAFVAEVDKSKFIGSSANASSFQGV